MVDPGRVRRLLELLAEFRGRLAGLAALPAERYIAEHAFEGRYLVLASAQACLDIANHLISSEGWRTPLDFRDTFSVLEESGLLDAELAARLRALAGLRNRLVHLYADVDDALVQRALAEGLADLDEFARAVARLTSRPEPG